ncbi:hypothetical protein Ndes2526B_g09320 [Nannochloris sp. 'desiccata']|nr:hypothetical protein KSW81_003651 [Chlorella desiccata (nom. nud.)]KAH7616006.1 hypothetical protein NADE_000841 [Chlorella desiccata (nom. nud.)]
MRNADRAWKYSDRNNRKRILTEAELDEILGRSKKQAATILTNTPGAAAGAVPQESDGLVVLTTNGNGAMLPPAENYIEREDKKQQEKQVPNSWQELLLQQHGHPTSPVVLPPVPPLSLAPFPEQQDKKQD